MIRSGIDEAGLGPILGPYCGGLAILKHNCRPETLWNICERVGIPMADSKKIYTSGNIKNLELRFLSFYYLYTNIIPQNAGDIINISDSQIPWLQQVKMVNLPLSISKDLIFKTASKLGSELKRHSISIENYKALTIPALHFNQLLDQSKNKAQATQKILSPLILEALKVSDKLLVDRQGGRRYYGDWLLELAPGKKIKAFCERKDLSSYEVENCQIDFMVKGDENNFETALASLFAKYTRELFMRGFNQYWKNLIPDLKETAGYYTDGQRFIQELKNKGLLPLEEKTLIRSK